jgi:hypothetical protein
MCPTARSTTNKNGFSKFYNAGTNQPEEIHLCHGHGDSKYIAQTILASTEFKHIEIEGGFF